MGNLARAGLSAVFVALFAFVWVPAAHALDAPDLADDAETYRQQLVREVATATDPLPSHSELFRLAKLATIEGRWHDAVDAYEALAGASPDDYEIWLRLASVWASFDPIAPAGLSAAYNAYRYAPPDPLTRADALLLIAESLQDQQRWRLATAVFDELSRLLPEDESFAERRDWLRRQYGFHIEETVVNFDRDVPQVCLEFSDPLMDPRYVRLADYVRIAPEIPIEVLAEEGNLCIEGVRHGETYDITVLAGIPSADGERLIGDDTFQQTVDEREPQVGFRANAYVLPRHGEATAPLTTVNVDEVELRLLRINDRNLLQQILQDRIGGSIDGYDAREIAETAGEVIWEGRMAIEGERNRSVTTGVPIGEALAETEPGIYILAARNADETEHWLYDNLGTQWLVLTDIGLLTFSGNDGLHVAVRSLATGVPVEGTRLTLLSRNNTVLGEAQSDADGMASFDAGLVRGQGGNRPAAVLAYHELDGFEDFNFLELTGPAFDLSDRGVSGRPEPGPLDAYLYTERGVYRPGETVFLTTLLRNERADGLPGLPLTIKVLRPDGIESNTFTLDDDGGGAYALSLPLPGSARTGTWTAEAYVDPEGSAIGSVTFQVEDFVPLRVRVAMETAEESLRPGQAAEVGIQADYLYGAPAVDLYGEAELILRPTATPFADWAGYSFGLAQETFDPQRLFLDIPPTDGSGHTNLEVLLDELPDTTLPLEAQVRASLFDVGGRPINQQLVLPIHRLGPWIGVRATEGGRVQEDSVAAFDVIALDGEGQRIAADLQYQLVREVYDYQWFSSNGVWDYRVVYRDRVLAAGEVAAGLDAPGTIAEPVDWGAYRIDVFDSAGLAATSIRFYAGWWSGPIDDDTPDTLQISLDQQTYRAGDTARVHLEAPFAGDALVLVVNDRLLHAVDVAVPEDGTTVEIPVGDDWGVGAYVLATAFRPAGAEERARGPGRAVGVAWFDMDASARTMSVEMALPEEVRPRQTVTVPVTVTGIPAGEQVYLTLAAVDEGILLLTDFASPDPIDHYFGKRALGMEMRDAYGRLIISEGRRGQIRTGGDGDQLGALSVRISETVSLFSGIVQVGDDGQVDIPIAIPDYNGELRLMAVAWTLHAVGSAAEPLTVRDPLVSQISLPRFLAPEDRALATLSLHNVAGVAGPYQAEITTTGAVSVAGDGLFALDLDEDERFEGEFTLVGDRIGVGEVTLTLSGPDGFSVARHWAIAVRPPQPYVTERIAGRLDPGHSLIVDTGVVETFVPQTTTVAASFSTRPNFDVPGLLRELDGYPYGCLEQTVSRAMPMLYLAEVAESWGDDYQPDDVRRRVQAAVNRTMTMQQRDGGFGIWGPFGESRPWLDAYALDFITRAAEQGYDVPQTAWHLGLDHLQDYLNRWDTRERCYPAAGYALYTLARAGEASVADLRYYADTCLEKFPTPLARAQLATALSLYGERERAALAFAMTGDRRVIQADYPLQDYGSSLRDRAAIVALMAEASVPLEIVLDEADVVGELFAQARYTSTQEQAWLLLAAHALLSGQDEMVLAVNGENLPPSTDALDLYPTGAQLSRGLRVQNLGDQPIRRVVTVRGIPAEPMPAESNGIEITRSFLDLDGNVLDITAEPLRQNDLVVVVIEGSNPTEMDHDLLVVDLLPAGLEIENPDIGGGRGMEDLVDQLHLSFTDHVERRDDRFVAALPVYSDTERFAVAYVARAVTPGEFVLPGAFAEDMYKPDYFARTATDRITILPHDE